MLKYRRLVVNGFSKQITVDVLNWRKRIFIINSELFKHSLQCAELLP